VANHKSAQKRARQSLKKRERNTGVKSALKTIEKRVRGAITQKDAQKAAELLRTLASRIDKAAKSGVVHANAASRKISRLATQVSALAGK
jgi:small subunit ribosomal protein S20